MLLIYAKLEGAERPQAYLKMIAREPETYDESSFFDRMREAKSKWGNKGLVSIGCLVFGEACRTLPSPLMPRISWA
jgi:hypothetical protein